LRRIESLNNFHRKSMFPPSQVPSFDANMSLQQNIGAVQARPSCASCHEK